MFKFLRNKNLEYINGGKIGLLLLLGSSVYFYWATIKEVPGSCEYLTCKF